MMASPIRPPQVVFANLQPSQQIWLFLDYDGTLADFAPNPDIIQPDDALIDLLSRLTRHPCIHTAIVSGRRLRHITQLVPIKGIWLAGTYGIEMRAPDGYRLDMLPYDTVRPIIEQIKPEWQALLQDNQNLYLEDKGWSLAIHGRFASEKETEKVFVKAKQIANQHIIQNMLNLLGGNKFLEVCPIIAAKPKAIEYILKKKPAPGSIPVYLGDDDKDELAFSTILQHGGIPIVVAAEERTSQALYRLPTPQAVRAWLEDLLKWLDK